MNLSLAKYIENYFSLENLKRCQLAPRIFEESVLEHAGMVTAAVLKLYDLYDFNLLKAIKLSINHDYAEYLLGDTPSTAKELWNDDFKKAFEDYEYKIIREDIDEETEQLLRDLNNEVDNCDTLIVKYADVLSMSLYAERELKVSTENEHFLKIRNHVKPRLEALEKRLEKYLRQPN